MKAAFFRPQCDFAVKLHCGLYNITLCHSCIPLLLSEGKRENPACGFGKVIVIVKKRDL